MAPKLPGRTMPVAVVPELGVDTESIRKAARQLGGVFYKRALGMIHNEMIVAADDITEDAKGDLTKYFDNPTHGTGLLAQGLFHWPRPVVDPRGRIVMGFGWLRRYGRVLEYGPSVTQWMIYPKWRKALRWFSGGFIGPTQSGVAGRNVRFAKKVKHIDKPEHRRPHLVPAVKEGIPKLERRIAKGLEREFLRLRL